MQELLQCVIKVEDIGNATEFIEVVEEDTDYISQYDVDVEYQSEDEEPTIQYLLAYRKEGDTENFYTEDNEIMEFDN